jgi:hypothetical protein
MLSPTSQDLLEFLSLDDTQIIYSDKQVFLVNRNLVYEICFACQPMCLGIPAWQTS